MRRCGREGAGDSGRAGVKLRKEKDGISVLVSKLVQRLQQC